MSSHDPIMQPEASAREPEGRERITSPEQLNDYIKVATPGAWVLLSAALLFFAGMFYWLLTGELEVNTPVRMVVHPVDFLLRADW